MNRKAGIVTASLFLLAFQMALAIFSGSVGRINYAFSFSRAIDVVLDKSDQELEARLVSKLRRDKISTELHGALVLVPPTKISYVVMALGWGITPTFKRFSVPYTQWASDMFRNCDLNGTNLQESELLSADSFSSPGHLSETVTNCYRELSKSQVEILAEYYGADFAILYDEQCRFGNVLARNEVGLESICLIRTGD